MSSTSIAPPRITRSRSKYLLFGFIALMIGYVIIHNERFLIDPTNVEWQHIRSFKWWLLPHGLAGASALLLGPMQFFDRLRQKYTKLHRVAGRIYVFSVFIAAPLGFYVQYFEERLGESRSFSIAAAADATLWITTTAIAFAFILRGKVQQHRQWMTRSFAVALVFVEVRVVAGLTGWENKGSAVTETIVWCCLVASILLADIVLQWQESSRSRPLAAKAHAAR